MPVRASPGFRWRSTPGYAWRVMHLRTHYVQPDVGHHGVFSGRRWNQRSYPVVRDVIEVSR